MALTDGVRGIGGTAAAINSDKLKISMEERILLLNPRVAPFLVFSKKIESKSVDQAEFSLLKDEMVPFTAEVNNSAGYSDSDTDIVVTNLGIFQTGDQVLVIRTGEVILVADADGTDLDVTGGRGWAGTEAALVDGDELVLLARAETEYSSVPDAIATKATKATGYIQASRNSFAVTDYLDSVSLYGGPELPYQAKKKGIEHLYSIERQLLFGKAKKDTSGSYVRYASGGVNEHITTNRRTIAGGVMTTLEMEAAGVQMFEHGSDVKLLVGAPQVIASINLLAHGKIRIVPSEKSFGLRLREYDTSGGTWVLVPHPLFRKRTAWTKMAFSLDMKEYGYRWLQGDLTGDTTVWTNVQAAGVAGRIDEYRTYFGLRRGHEEPNGVIDGVTPIV